MPENRPLVSIISVSYKQAEVTCAMLNSLNTLSYPRLEVIVVDNASPEDPHQELLAVYPDLIYIRSEKNLGFSGGNNLGIQASRGEYLFFVNNDTELIEGSIEQLLALFEARPQLGAVSPLIYHHPDYHHQKGELIQYAGTTPVNPYTARNETIGAETLDRGQYKMPYPTAYVHGAAMMVRREVVEKVGMMPEIFFLYYEELDWCEKMREAGYEIYVEPRAKIHHKESVSVGKMSTLKTYYLNRNRILFMRRNRSSRQVWWFSLFLIFMTFPKNVILHLIRGEWAHARAFTQAVLWHLKSESRAAIKPLPVLTVASHSSSKTKV